MSKFESQPDRDSAVVGQLTAGLLHEFSNVLQGIIGLADMLETDETLPEKAKIGVKAIRRLGQNATDLVQKFSAEGETRPASIREAEDIEAADAVTKAEPPKKEHKMILVAEDDPLVLNVVTGMLKHLGYNTLRAQDGMEALDLYNTNTGNIGLIIADMVMPRMGGLQLAEDILKKAPDTKIVVMTGYLQEELEIDPDEFGLFGWLEKPMTAQRLNDVVIKAFGS
jgi:CheY-like chemotaxis protein